MASRNSSRTLLRLVSQSRNRTRASRSISILSIQTSSNQITNLNHNQSNSSLSPSASKPPSKHLYSQSAHQKRNKNQAENPQSNSGDNKNSKDEASDKQKTAGSNGKSQKKKNDRKKEEEDDSLPVGVSPWARFMDVLKSEYAKSQEIQENVRELTGTAQGLKDSEAAQKMRQAYTALRLETLIKENPKLAAMASSLSSTGRSVSDAINHAAKEIEESRLVQAAKKVNAELDKRIAEPIRQTEAYKIVEDTVDFSQGALRYGGYVEREERIRKRKKRLERLGKANSGLGVPGGPGSQESEQKLKEEEEAAAGLEPGSVSEDQNPSSQLNSSSTSDIASSNDPQSNAIKENPDAAPALVLHATANQEDDSKSTKRSRLASITPEPIRRAWENFQATYEDSDNPVIASMRTVTGAIGRFFDETETAKVVRMIKEMDPDFEFDGFLRDLREYIVPEIVDAYVDCDFKGLKLWTSEAAYNVITAPMQAYIQRGIRPESQVLDLKGIDILSAKILEEREIPVFVVTFRTHEIKRYPNLTSETTTRPKSEKGSSNKKDDKEKGEEIKGEENVQAKEEIEHVQYVIVLTRESEKVGNEITGGWKVIDMARRSTIAFL